MERKLEQHRQQNVKVEDVAQRSFPGEFLHRLVRTGCYGLVDPYSDVQRRTLAREMHKKHTDIIMPVIVTW